jgi:hypothetical protein
MDRTNAHVGEWSPLVRLEAVTRHELGTFEGRENVSEPLPFAFGSSQDWTEALPTSP